MVDVIAKATIPEVLSAPLSHEPAAMTAAAVADSTSSLGWKTDWDQARRGLTDWWDHKGLALHVTAPRDEPASDIPHPGPPASLEATRTDPIWRVAARHVS